MKKKNYRNVRIALALLVFLGGFLSAWAFWLEPSSLTVRQHTIKIKNWNPAFNNFKIVAVSDIHGGGNFIDEAKIRRVVELANQQNADLVVLLGDFVNQQRFDRTRLEMPMSVIADNLRGLQAKHGAFAVLGNHDFWYDDDVIRDELERVGVRVLENEAAVIEHNGQPLRLLGLKDIVKYGSWHDYSREARAALANVDAGGDVLTLTHNPDAIVGTTGEYSIAADFKLMLSGHTHGGQCWFPIIGAPVVPSNYGQKYAYGHVIENNVHLFVTPGIGTSVFPVRFNVPPEVSVLTIKSDYN